MPLVSTIKRQQGAKVLRDKITASTLQSASFEARTHHSNIVNNSYIPTRHEACVHIRYHCLVGRQPAAGAPVARGCARPPAASSNGVDRLSWTQGEYLYTAEQLVTARVVSFTMQQPEAATFSRGWAIKLCLWQYTRCDRPFRVDSSCACSHLLIVSFLCAGRLHPGWVFQLAPFLTADGPPLLGRWDSTYLHTRPSAHRPAQVGASVILCVRQQHPHAQQQLHHVSVHTCYLTALRIQLSSKQATTGPVSLLQVWRVACQIGTSCNCQC